MDIFKAILRGCVIVLLIEYLPNMHKTLSQSLTLHKTDIVVCIFNLSIWVEKSKGLEVQDQLGCV